jgi:hypothetical protein
MSLNVVSDIGATLRKINLKYITTKVINIITSLLIIQLKMKILMMLLVRLQMTLKAHGLREKITMI